MLRLLLLGATITTAVAQVQGQCAALCTEDSSPWPEKCAWTTGACANCGACAPRCESWCETHSSPWEQKCTWASLACVDCASCLNRCESWCADHPDRDTHGVCWWRSRACASCSFCLGEVVPPVTTASCPPAGAPFDPPLPPVFPPHSPPSYEMSNEDIAVFSDSMSILPLVNISGSFDVAGKLVAISRSDNSVRAVATRLNMPIPPVPSWPFAGLLPFSFLLYGNVNDGIVHFVFQPSEPYLSMYVLDLVGPEVDFVPNADAGTYELPLVFRF